MEKGTLFGETDGIMARCTGTFETESGFEGEIRRWSEEERPKAETKRKRLSRYEGIEESVLDGMEYLLSQLDNVIALRAMFPNLEKRMNNVKFLKPLKMVLAQVAKIYVIVILLYIRRFLMRLMRLNRLIKMVKTEYTILENNFQTITRVKNKNNANGCGNYTKNNRKTNKVTQYHEKSLQILYTEKAKAIFELVGYVSDLLLNLGALTRRIKLGKPISRILGIFSWALNMYRICRDGNNKNEQFIHELETRYSDVL